MTSSPLRRLLAMSAEHRSAWRSALLLLLLATVADMCVPLLVSRYINDVLVQGEVLTAGAGMLALAYVLAMIVVAVCHYRQAVFLQHIAQQVIATLRRQAHARLLRRDMNYFDTTPLGALVSRLANDTESVKELFVQVVGTYIQSGFRVVGIFCGMALLDLRLMWICAVFLPVALGMMVLYRRLTTPVFQRARALLADIQSRLSEALQGVRLVQFFGQETVFDARFGDVVDAHFRTRHRNLRLDALLLRPFLDFVQALLLIAILYHFAGRSFVEAVDVGVIYAFINYIGRFTEPVVEVTQKLTLLQQATVAGERVFSLIDGATVDVPLTGARPESHAIALSEVSFRYPGALRPALQGVSVMVPQGSFTGIVGPSGSGKSTLAALLLRFHAPEAGTMTWGGAPYASVVEAHFRRAVGWVPQDAFMFAGTVRSNILIDRTMNDAALTQCLEAAGLHGLLAGLADGLDTRIAERGTNLSTGQRQLVALARALVREPAVLLLDEATASLDSESEQAIQRALQSLRGRITVIAIAHRLSTIADADTIIVMQQGRVAEQGTHAGLLAAEGVYHAMYRMQTASV